MAEDFEQIESEQFLIREGLELLASYRLIQSEGARKAVLILISAIVAAEAAAGTQVSALAALSALMQ